jgi:hypothetical protein
MKIPEKTNRISIKDGKLECYDENNNILSIENIDSINCSSFAGEDTFACFDSITCSCEGHTLTFSMFDDKEDPHVYISSWHRPNAMPYGWRYKIKCIWQILRSRFYYIDEFLFTKKQMLVMRAIIDSYIKKLEDKEKKLNI